MNLQKIIENVRIKIPPPLISGRLLVLATSRLKLLIFIIKAILNGQDAIVKILVENGFKVDVIDKRSGYNNTPLFDGLYSIQLHFHLFFFLFIKLQRLLPES